MLTAAGGFVVTTGASDEGHGGGEVLLTVARGVPVAVLRAAVLAAFDASPHARAAAGRASEEVQLQEVEAGAVPLGCASCLCGHLRVFAVRPVWTSALGNPGVVHVSDWRCCTRCRVLRPPPAGGGARGECFHAACSP
jgi:hypothetical protein